MSIKEEMPEVDSPGKAMRFSDRLGSLSVRWKIRIAYWAGILLTACIVIVLAGTFQRRTAIHNGYDKVYLLRSTKTRLAEAWFERLADKMKSFALDPQTLNLQGQLSESFLNIENDNFSTPGAESPAKIASLLESYYKTEIVPVLEPRMNKKIPVSSLLPADNKQQILQYLYIAANTKAFGLKQTMIKASDGSAYSTLHAQVQPNMVEFAREAGISDVLFVDYKSGYVVYSMKKNLDYATNLYDGPYHNSGLGTAFKAAIGLPAGSFQFTDESLYAPVLLKPTLFISAPLYSGSEIKGAVVFSVDVSALDGLLAMGKDDQTGIPGLKSFFVGADLLYRNNDPALSVEPERYVRRMKRLADDGLAYAGIEKFNTTAMVQKVNSLAFDDGINGKERLTEYRTETGEQVLSSYGPVDIPGLKWLLVSQLDKSQALKPVKNMMVFLTIISLFLALLFYIAVHVLSDKLAYRLSSLGGLLHAAADGEKKNMLRVAGGDEIQTAVTAVRSLKQRINEASEYTDHLGEGNLDKELSLSGEDDTLGTSLNNLKKILTDRREQENTRIREDEIRNWTTHGIAMFNDILRMDNNNLEKLCLNIIRNIIQYLSANQGGIFLVDKEENNTYLDLVAAYAFDRQKFLKKRIGMGEGLAGTCALEKKTILLSRIPQDYMEITSGLGGAKPSCLLIVPLKKDEEMLGVMEMASFNPFKPHEVEFVEKVAESIASALITVRLHLQTSQYLEKFQQQAEEMKAQDEELRQNIEELQATHEQMERMKQEEDARNQQMLKEIMDKQQEIEKSSIELQKEKALLDALLNNVPEHIYFKDKESKFLRFSKSMLGLFGLNNAEDLIGKSDFDFFDDEHARPAYEGEQEIIRTGKAIIDLEEKEVMDDGRVSWVNTTKMPLRDSNGNIIGTFGISKNITHLKRLEQDALEKTEELKAQEEELRQNLEEMHATQDDMKRQIEENEKMQEALSKEKSLLDALLNNVPEHIYFKDKESRFLRFSKSMLKLFKLKKSEDLMGKSDFDFFDDEHARPAYEGEQEIIRTGKAIIDLEEKEVMDDGRVSWVNTTKMPLRNAQGEIIGTFGISKDISRLKKLELDANDKADNLIKFRKLLIDILDRIPGKIFLKDENGVFVIVNSAVASIYNKSPEQIIGTTDYDNHPDENVDEWRKQELEIVKKGASTYVHLEKIKGQQHYLNTTKMPFELATSGKTGLLGIQFDISDKKMLEEKVDRLNKEIEKLKKGRE